MSLTLDNFKKVIVSQILARGREYYIKDRVVDLSLDEEAAWSAVVEGTDSYDVTISQSENGELCCACTCPYDHGPYCKHIAAVLYAIEKTFPEYFGIRKAKPATSRRTRTDQLHDALQAASHEQLVAVLLELAAANRDIMNQLLLQLDVVGEKPADYRRLVKDALRPPAGAHGFLDYRASMEAASKVARILNQAGSVLATRPQQALSIYQAVLELSVDAIGYADDSSGALGGIIEYALEGIRKCRDRLPVVDQDNLFDNLIQQAGSQRYANWNWRWNLFDIAVELADDKSKRARLEAALEACRPSGHRDDEENWSQRYLEERIDEAKLAIILVYDGEEAALAFMHANKRHHGFRRHLVDYYLNRGDLNIAFSLASEGITAAERSRLFGLVNIYREFLLEIARRDGDIKNVVSEARALWLGRGEDKYLDLLRKSIPAAEWESFRERLLADGDCQPIMAAQVLAADGLWSRLLELALRYPTIASAYQDELESRYPEAMADHYARIVEIKLKRTTDRATYQEAAEFLRRIKRLGYPARADEMTRDFISRFPQRRAMIDELRKV
jgi:uncharacterized Zn finger protein